MTTPEKNQSSQPTAKEDAKSMILPLGMKLMPYALEEIIDEDKLVIAHHDDSQDNFSELSKEMNLYNRMEKECPDWRTILGPMDCSKPFFFNDNTYRSIEHACLAECVKLQDTKTAEEFAMDSGTELSLMDAQKVADENNYCNHDFMSAENIVKWCTQRHDVFKRIAFSKFKAHRKFKHALIMTYPAQLWISYTKSGHHTLDMSDAARVARVISLEEIREHFVRELRPQLLQSVGSKRMRTYDHLEPTMITDCSKKVDVEEEGEKEKNMSQETMNQIDELAKTQETALVADEQTMQCELSQTQMEKKCDGYEAPLSMDVFPDAFGLIPKNDEGDFDPSKQPLPCDEQFPSSLTELLHYDRDTMQVVKVMHDKYGSKIDIRNLWKGRFTKKGIRLNEDVFDRFVKLIPKIQDEMKSLRDKHGFNEVQKGADVMIRSRRRENDNFESDEEEQERLLKRDLQMKEDGINNPYQGQKRYNSPGGNQGQKYKKRDPYEDETPHENAYKNQQYGGPQQNNFRQNNWRGGYGGGNSYGGRYNNNSYGGNSYGGGQGMQRRRWPSKQNAGGNYKNNFF